MSKKPSIQEEARITLQYHLVDLPTAQHKAGLAGLVLLIQNLKERKIEPRPNLVDVDSQSAVFEFDESELSELFSDYYAGYPTEARYKSKLPKKTPIRIDETEKEINGKRKIEKWYVYDDFRPKGNLFRYLLQRGKESPWLKLWQDMLWAVLRAQPTTREDYRRSADKQPVTMGAKLWPKLHKAQWQKNQAKPVTDSIAGSIFVGAQDRNAERVIFTGPVEQNLLLHFWPLVTPVFVPQMIDIKNKRRTDQGYLLAIPEVADLAYFVEEVRGYWQSLSPEVFGYSHRPATSLIDVPEEAGLKFLYQLSQQRLRKGHGNLTGELHAIEWYHQEKQGNNVRMHGHGRLTTNTNTLREYSELRKHGGNPLFKSLLIRNLVRNRPWFEGTQTLFGTYPAEFFIHSPKSPRFRAFGLDVKSYFRDRIIQSLEQKEKRGMTDKIDQIDLLARRVYRLIRTYVERRTDDKSDIKLAQLKKDEKDRNIYPKAYREAREKVAKEAFLAMRGRNGRDFIEYFTGTICSVPQFFGKEDEFVEMSQVLIKKPETVKDLSMLALSAWSWLPSANNESQETTTETKG